MEPEAVKVRMGRGSSVPAALSVGGITLTPDGEVAVLGLVHAYLARWLALASEGAVPPPPGYPDATYRYEPGSLVLPMLPADASRVVAVLTAILRRPGMARGAGLRRSVPSAYSVIPASRNNGDLPHGRPPGAEMR